MSAHSEPVPQPLQRMGGLLMGHFVAQCIHAVAVLGVADLMAKGHTTIEALAAATLCHQPSLQRVMRALVRVGLFTENAPDRYELTPLGATLRSDAPDSLRDAATFLMSAPLWTACGALLDTLRSGEPSFVGLHDATIYQYLARHPESAAVFNRWMTTQSHQHNAAILEAYDFSGVATIVDVGGGQGATVTAVLHRYPMMRGILFDLPAVVATAPPDTSIPGDRYQVVAGDMLGSVPAGGDLYLIKRVLMDRSDGDAATVLRNCLAAMNPAGRILVIDPMLPSGAEPHPNWLIDIIMLTVLEGRCRSEAEFRHLFGAVGLTLARVVATRSPNFLLEAVPTVR